MADRESPSETQSGTALVTMELEAGVVGDLSTLEDLVEAAAERGTLAACGRLVAAARQSAVPIVHCVAQWRSDRRGTPLNTPLVRHLASIESQILEHTEAVELIPELSDCGGDLVSSRYHGVAPFWGTDLEPALRSLGITHVVVCGVSLNVGIPGLVIGAVDRGFEVTVASDAVVGVPADYGDTVLRHTLSVLAELRTVDELCGSWSTDGSGSDVTPLS